jgi:CARDB
MRLALAATVVLLAAVAAGSAVGAPQRATVRLVECDRIDHSAAFRGRMRQMAGARRMAMRFTLLERIPGKDFARVDAAGLGRWHHSRPGKAVFSYRQGVKGLVKDGAYRALLAFRWYDRRGKLIREERRRSPVCDQVGPRPNLRARVIGSGPGASPGVTRYSVRVGNAGRLAASAIDVRLAVDGAGAGSATIPTLAPGASTVVTLRGPDCKRAVDAVVDPADAIEESNEADNAHSVSCAELAP